MNITKGPRKVPVKTVIYGPAGIGKSTFASFFPDPLFIDVEGSTNQMDVARTDTPRTWESLIGLIEQVIKERPCKTLVIDTVDWAEKLCTKYILNKHGVDGIERVGGGYGKGYTYLAEEFQRILRALNLVIEAGMHVVLCAHAQMRKFEQPDEMGAYDRWELKLEKKTAPLVKEWADNLFFVNYKTIVITTENKTRKAAGGQRVMYCTHNPVWDAKNRYCLPDEVPFDYMQVAWIYEDNPNDPVKVVQDAVRMVDTMEAEEQKDPKEPLLVQARALMERAGVQESQIQTLCAAKGFYPMDTPLEGYSEEFLQNMIIDQWDKLVTLLPPVAEDGTVEVNI